MDKNRQVNWDAVQAPRNKGEKAAPRQGDVNVKQMSMGSWHADRTKQGARRRKGN